MVQMEAWPSNLKLPDMLMKQRCVIFAIVTAAAIVILYLMPGLDLFSPPVLPLAVLGGTWQGPVLLLLIPATLVWVSFGARSGRAKTWCLTAAVVLFAVCIVLIWYADMMFDPLYIWDWW